MKEAEGFKYKKECELILCAAFNVYNLLGYGFLEKVYENALCIELKRLGLDCRSQEPIDVTFRDQVVGNYVADIVVDDKLILEIKAVNSESRYHDAQLIHYLKATGKTVGYVLNFGMEEKLYYKRFVN